MCAGWGGRMTIMVQGTGKSRAKHFGPAFSTFLEKNVSPFVHFNTICVVPRLIKTYLLNSLILSQNIKLIAKTIQLVRSVGGWDGEGGGSVNDSGSPMARGTRAGIHGGRAHHIPHHLCHQQLKNVLRQSPRLSFRSL